VVEQPLRNKAPALSASKNHYLFLVSELFDSCSDGSPRRGRGERIGGWTTCAGAAE
jgi:hypothetical protein